MRVQFAPAAALLILCAASCQAFAATNCSSPANVIVAENCNPGNPSTQWDTQQSNAGDPTIQGYATQISVNAGQTIFFKINTDASAYTITIYRIGYYQGLGAREIATVTPSARLPQSQPACLTDSVTNLYDCGNWAVSASWTVPATAVSGVYIAHLVRTDTGGDSHIIFVVRNDSSHSDVLFQTSDESWQAYNDFGGHSLYGPLGVFNLANRAYKVSYNRPFDTRTFENASWFFYSEYPMIKFLEANGYDVTYSSSIDSAISGSLITNHKIFLSVGHDEYVDPAKRANIQSAINAGVNAGFFTGNEFFWKVRWENSIDGTNTPNRTMVCYKETLNNAPLDPEDPSTWTGTWRDPRFSPPADGGQPENMLTGTIFKVNGWGPDNNALSIQIPTADGQMRFWRNTSVAAQSPGQVWSLPGGTLGYEWDADDAGGPRPAGVVRLSTATYQLTTDYLMDYGGVYGGGLATHHMTLYRAPSGALVFGAGTIQWPWGLDSDHDTLYYDGFPPDVNMQQATVNLFADMGIQPTTLISGLVPASQSTDTTPPQSAISSPAAGAVIAAGNVTTVSGTAQDFGGGVVGGVEISADGGKTWHPATSGRSNWTYSWSPVTAGPATLLSRAVDDSGNIEAPSTSVAVNVAAPDCPCTVLGTGTPGTVDGGDIHAGEYGMRFQADYNGFITGIRFYKSSDNTGVHIGHLWTNGGALLGSATFANESASGWQQANFSSPIPITAGTTYVVSYFTPSGHYSADTGTFTSPIDNPPLHGLQDGVSGLNGVFAYSTVAGVFPTTTYGSGNYWADVVFLPGESMPGAAPSLLTSPTSLSFSVYSNEAPPAAQSVNIYNQGTGALSWTASASASWIVLSPTSGSTPSTLSVSVNPTGLASGTYNGAISIKTSAGTQTVSVSMALTTLVTSENFINGTLVTNENLTNGAQATIENFMNGSLQGWIPVTTLNNWSMGSSGLQFTPAAGDQINTIYAGDSSWSNYSFQVQMQVNSLANYPGGIRGRVNPATGAGYLVWIYPGNPTGNLHLFRAADWTINALTDLTGATVPTVPITAGAFHTLQLSFSGSQIQVLFDGQVVITATDSTYSSGLIALDVDNQAITYGNVLVTAPTVNPSDLILNTSSLAFTANLDGANPSPQTVNVTSTSSGAQAWSALPNVPWLTLSSSSPATPSTLQVTANTSQLAAGAYTGSIQLSSLGSGNNPAINVTLNVVVPPPVIVLSANSLNFTALTGQAAPPAQALTISNGGFGSFPWSASSDSSWLVVSAGSGSTPATINVSVNPSGLALGTYNGNVIMSAAGVGNSPQTVPVTLTVLSEDMSENFSDLASGWISSPLGLGNDWSVTNGVYSFNGSGLSLKCAGNSAWTDYIVDADVQLSDLFNWPGGIRGRVNPLTGAGYVVWLYPSTGFIRLYRDDVWSINSSNLTKIAENNLSFDTNVHDLEMSFLGGQINVYWDGNLVLTASDSNYNAGFICLDANDQPISYSNIRVASRQTAVTLDPVTSLNFTSGPGSPPPTQTINITAGGASTTWQPVVNSNSPWLQASASSTLTPGTLSLSVNTSGLAQGAYNGSIALYAPGATNSPLVVPVTVSVATSGLSVAPGSLAFFGAEGYTTPSAPLSVTNPGTGTVAWSAGANAPWITLGATSGTAPSTINVSPNASGLANGQYSGNVTITAGPNVFNSPATIPISLQVGTLAFSDNFPADDTNWTISPVGNASAWSFTGSTYTFSGSAPSQSYTGSSSWANYAVSSDFQLSSLNNYPGGIRGRVNISTGAAYTVWIYPATGQMRLWRSSQWNIDTDQSLTELGIASIPIDTNVHNLTMSFSGSQITVYVDNQLAIQVNDNAYTQGAIALDGHNQPIAFSNMSVITF